MTTERKHIFKVSDGSWVFSGTAVPSNMRGDEYVQAKLPVGEKFDLDPRTALTQAFFFGYKTKKWN